MEGFELLTTMVMTLTGREMTPFNMDQWEERRFTEDELSLLRVQHAKLNREKVYYIISKVNVTRSERSVAENQETFVTTELQMAERRWNQYVTKLLTMFLGYRNESSSWLCNFANLYSEYRFASSTNNDSLTANFDTFLYSKILHLKKWKDCVNFKEDPDQWCQAWRRINSTVDDWNGWKKISSTNFLKDTGTLMSWLSEEILMCKCPEDTSTIISSEESIKSNFTSDMFKRFFENGNGLKSYGYVLYLHQND